MTKYNAFSIIGLIIASAAAAWAWFWLIEQSLSGNSLSPLIVIGLLLATALGVIIGWVEPSAGPVLILFAGAMLATYRVNLEIGPDSLIAGLITGLPFLVATISIAIGNKLAESS